MSSVSCCCLLALARTSSTWGKRGSGERNVPTFCPGLGGSVSSHFSTAWACSVSSVPAPVFALLSTSLELNLLPQASAGSVALSPRPGSPGSRRVCALPESRLWTRLSLWRGVLSPHPLALVEGQPDVGSRVPTLTSVRARGPCLSRLCQQPDLGVSILRGLHPQGILTGPLGLGS